MDRDGLGPAKPEQHVLGDSHAVGERPYLDGFEKRRRALRILEYRWDHLRRRVTPHSRGRGSDGADAAARALAGRRRARTSSTETSCAATAVASTAGAGCASAGRIGG